jgi:hypothetical protein
MVQVVPLVPAWVAVSPAVSDRRARTYDHDCNHSSHTGRRSRPIAGSRSYGSDRPLLGQSEPRTTSRSRLAPRTIS